MIEILGISSTELIGHAASVVVLSSFLMKNMLKLRIVNMSGAVLFLAYGILIYSWPIITTNTIIFFIHVHYLVKRRLRLRKAYATEGNREPGFGSQNTRLGNKMEI